MDGRPPPLGPCDPKRIGDAVRFTWPEAAIQVELDRFTERADGLHADITIARIVGGRLALVSDGRMSLQSTNARDTLARSCERKVPGTDWSNLLETVCFDGKRLFREGEPPVDLAVTMPSGAPRWIIKPYWEAAGPTVLFGPGGSMKTYSADSMALGLVTNKAIFGYPIGDRRRVLFLDYEADRDTHINRMLALQRGHDIPEVPEGWFFYREMTTPLGLVVPAVRRWIAELKIGAIFIDSLSLACGGELEEADSILRCFAAMRTFGVPCLIVTHVTKAQMQGAVERNHRLSPFGSIFTENAARNCWSVTSAIISAEDYEDGDVQEIALIHQKTNNGRYQKRHGYEVTFVNDPEDEDAILGVEYRRKDLADMAAFEDDVSLVDKLTNAMKSGRKTPAELQKVAPKEPPNKIRATLSYLKRKGVADSDESHGWGLIDKDHERLAG